METLQERSSFLGPLGTGSSNSVSTMNAFIDLAGPFAHQPAMKSQIPPQGLPSPPTTANNRFMITNSTFNTYNYLHPEAAPLTAQKSDPTPWISSENKSEPILIPKRSNAIYETQLMCKGRGFPLWIPQPNMRLPTSHRAKGVAIGDVGIITEYGAFDFLFNICISADDPLNPPDLPQGFATLQLKAWDVREFRDFPNGSYLASPSVGKAVKGDDCRVTTFESSGNESALLSMPEGAYHEEVNDLSKFRDYAERHVESWYDFVLHRRGRKDTANGDIRLVVGVDKSTSWGIASFSDPFKLQLKETVGGIAKKDSPYTWDHTGMSGEVKSGPDSCDNEDIPQTVGGKVRNQTLFVRTFNILLGNDAWDTIQKPKETFDQGGSDPDASGLYHPWEDILVYNPTRAMTSTRALKRSVSPINETISNHSKSQRLSKETDHGYARRMLSHLLYPDSMPHVSNKDESVSYLYSEEENLMKTSWLPAVKKTEPDHVRNSRNRSSFDTFRSSTPSGNPRMVKGTREHDESKKKDVDDQLAVENDATEGRTEYLFAAPSSTPPSVAVGMENEESRGTISLRAWASMDDDKEMCDDDTTSSSESSGTDEDLEGLDLFNGNGMKGDRVATVAVPISPRPLNARPVRVHNEETAQASGHSYHPTATMDRHDDWGVNSDIVEAGIQTPTTAANRDNSSLAPDPLPHMFPFKSAQGYRRGTYMRPAVSKDVDCHPASKRDQTDSTSHSEQESSGSPLDNSQASKVERRTMIQTQLADFQVLGDQAGQRMLTTSSVTIRTAELDEKRDDRTAKGDANDYAEMNFNYVAPFHGYDDDDADVWPEPSGLKATKVRAAQSSHHTSSHSDRDPEAVEDALLARLRCGTSKGIIQEYGATGHNALQPQMWLSRETSNSPVAVISAVVPHMASGITVNMTLVPAQTDQSSQTAVPSSASSVVLPRGEITSERPVDGTRLGPRRLRSLAGSRSYFEGRPGLELPQDDYGTHPSLAINSWMLGTGGMPSSIKMAITHDSAWYGLLLEESLTRAYRIRMSRPCQLEADESDDLQGLYSVCVSPDRTALYLESKEQYYNEYPSDNIAHLEWAVGDRRVDIRKLEDYLFGPSKSRSSGNFDALHRQPQIQQIKTQLGYDASLDRSSPAFGTLQPLDYHPARPVTLDVLLQILDGEMTPSEAIHTNTIGELRSTLRTVGDDEIQTHIVLRKLANALLNRACIFSDKDNVEEAIFYYRYLEPVTSAHSYQYLELVLGLCTAHYFRHQLLRMGEDLHSLNKYLDVQNDISYGTILQSLVSRETVD